MDDGARRTHVDETIGRAARCIDVVKKAHEFFACDRFLKAFQFPPLRRCGERAHRLGDSVRAQQDRGKKARGKNEENAPPALFTLRAHLTLFVPSAFFLVHGRAMLTVLFLGDVVGEPGRRAVIDSVPKLKLERGVDFVIVNGENAANGRGITPKITIDLLRAGVAVITSGDHIWDQREIVAYLPTEPRLLRPINYPPGTPGSGSIVLETPKGKVGVINVQGRTFMQPPLDNPFLAIEAEVKRMREETSIIFVDVHAETTSEKIAMGRFLDGTVSAVIGTHTHTQTADERIFPGGTAFLSDAGMCGPDESCLGREIEPIIQRFLTSRPVMYPVAKGAVKLHGVFVEIDEATGRALSIARLSELYEPAPQAKEAEDPR
jgi:metallophosphoesterase (TIGR00282 family)